MNFDNQQLFEKFVHKGLSLAIYLKWMILELSGFLGIKIKYSLLLALSIKQR